MCLELAFLFCVFCVFCVFNPNREPAVTATPPWLQPQAVARAACTPTEGAASPVAHLMLCDVPHAGLPSVLGLGAVADTRPLSDPSSTGDRAGRPRGPGAPATIDCREREGTVKQDGTAVLGA